MSPHLLQRTTILGTGLIGGSFALALRKFTPDMHITGWDRPEPVHLAKSCGALDDAFSGELAPALASADLVYIALPIGVTLNLLPQIAKHCAPRALVTDACSTKLRIAQIAAELFRPEAGPLFLGGHPMAGRELSGFPHADANLFQNSPYALMGNAHESGDSRVSAFVKIIEKFGARPLWLSPQQHDNSVGLASHLPQLAAIALACPSLSPAPASAIRFASPAAPTPFGATSSSPTRRFSLSPSIFSPAASMNSANASTPATSKPTSTPPTNSTNSSAASDCLIVNY